MPFLSFLRTYPALQGYDYIKGKTQIDFAIQARTSTATNYIEVSITQLLLPLLDSRARNSVGSSIQQPT